MTELHHANIRRRANVHFARAVARFLGWQGDVSPFGPAGEAWDIETHLKLAVLHAEEWRWELSLCPCSDCRGQRVLLDLEQRGYTLRWKDGRAN